MARNAPATIDELLNIPGLGARKLERFGEDLLEVVGAG
ncbi:HRDC domain-containing protein [Enterobacter hormaechei]